MYLKEVQGLFQGSFKDLLRKLKGCLKKVSSVFQENFKHNFKGASKMFNEVLLCIFVLRGPHRSYPSRRRACYSLCDSSSTTRFKQNIQNLIFIHFCMQPNF